MKLPSRCDYDIEFMIGVTAAAGAEFICGEGISIGAGNAGDAGVLAGSLIGHGCWRGRR